MVVNSNWGKNMSDIGITDKQLTSFLDGRWHSGNGFLCVGTFRIARADFESGVLGTTENQNKFIDKMAERLNSCSELIDALKSVINAALPIDSKEGNPIYHPSIGIAKELISKIEGGR